MGEPVYLTRADIGYAEGPNARVSLPYNERITHTVVSGDYEPDAGFQEVPDDADLDWVKAACRNVSRFHRTKRGWKGGIGYNLLIFPAVIGAPYGVVAEGQGIGRRGTHTESRNSQLGIAYWGDGTKEEPSPEAWAADQWVTRQLIRDGHLIPDYKATGHRNYSLTGKSCPGDYIYDNLHKIRGLAPQPQEWDDMASKAEVEDAAKAGAEAAVAELLPQLTALEDRIDALALGETGYEGHVVPEGGLLGVMRQLSPKGPGARSIRTLVEMVWNRHYDGDGQPR